MDGKDKDIKELEVLIDEYIGLQGTAEREQFEEGYTTFKLGFLIQEARKKRGLTQEQLADLSGTNKSYISKLERNLKDIRFSTLHRIVEEGLGGKLSLQLDLD